MKSENQTLQEIIDEQTVRIERLSRRILAALVACALLVGLLLAVALLISCAITDTYLPASPTPDSERLTLELQPNVWMKVKEVVYKFAHPEEIENDRIEKEEKRNEKNNL